MSHRLSAIVGLLLVAGTANAEEWKTPDGKIAVTVPDETRFLKGTPAPDTLAVWHTEDRTLVLLVGEVPFPSNLRLKQEPVAEGFVKEINRVCTSGKLTASTADVRGGFDVLTMSAQGERGGATVYFTQRLAAFGGKSYKVAVIGNGIDTRTDPDATAFVDSFKILAPSSPSPPQPAPGGSAPAPNQKGPGNRVAYIAGMIAGACLFVAGIAWIVNRLTRSTGKRRPTRRRRPETDRERDDDEDS